jgi:hypothetical protein
MKKIISISTVIVLAVVAAFSVNFSTQQEGSSIAFENIEALAQESSIACDCSDQICEIIIFGGGGPIVVRAGIYQNEVDGN